MVSYLRKELGTKSLKIGRPEERPWDDYIVFSYQMVFYYLWELTKVDPDDSAMFKCDHRMRQVHY